MSFARSMGYSTRILSRPVIGIANTYSEFNNCHRLIPELVNAVKRGLLQVRPALERLTPSGAAYVDGVEEPFDAIVAAIGFEPGLAGLIDGDGVLNELGEPLAPSGEPTARPGLYFIGFVHSLRGHLFEANRASRKLARNVAAYLGKVAD